MDFDKMYEGRFLKAGELGGHITLRISSVTKEELEDEKGAMKPKVVVTFGNAKKQLVANKTNGLCLKAMFGRETDAWVGKRVTFWPAPNPDQAKGFGDEICVRVYGSPDLPADLHLKTKAGRKKIDVVLRRVTLDAQGRTPQPGRKSAPAPQPTPPHDPATGEVTEPPKVTSTGEPPPDVALPGDGPPPLSDDDFRGGP